MSLHHLRVRKRMEARKKFLFFKQKPRLIDQAALAAGIIGPIMTIPQAWDIWAGQTAAGVSMVTWMTYLVVSVVWLIYGIYHRDTILIVVYTGWFVTKIMVVAGIFVYG